MQISTCENVDETAVVTVLPPSQNRTENPVDEIVLDECAENESCNTMNLNLRTAALSVQLQTKTPHVPMMAELATKLECAQARVCEAEEKLVNAIYRIGYLEAQLAEKDRLLAELRRDADTWDFRPDIAGELQELHDAHAGRATVLQDRIATLGGCTATVAGAWGIFNRTDAAIGEQTAICIFDDGESKALAAYVDSLEQLDEQSRAIVELQLMPEQEGSQSVVAAWRESITEFGDKEERIEMVG